jgi:hypothetical protein
MSPTHFSTSSECELRYILRRNYAAAVDWNCHLEKDIRKRIGGGQVWRGIWEPVVTAW